MIKSHLVVHTSSLVDCHERKDSQAKAFVTEHDQESRGEKSAYEPELAGLLKGDKAENVLERAFGKSASSEQRLKQSCQRDLSKNVIRTGTKRDRSQAESALVKHEYERIQIMYVS